MNDEQDHDENRMVGWILALAVVVAIAVALWMGMWGALIGSDNGGDKAATPTTPTVATVVAKAATEVDTAPAVATGVDYPESISLYFDSGKINLPVDTASQISKIVAWAKSNPNTKIGISGYHDKAGNPTVNADLAKSRAVGAREMLLSAGVPEDRIILVKPQSTDAGGPEDKQARRVDIYPAQ